MTSSTSAAAVARSVPLERIDVGANVRELDQAHVDALAGSITLRGLIVPLTVRPDGDRFVLVAGHHRHAACRKLGLAEVEVTLREQEASSGDAAAENILRKDLSPLGEARAVAQMLDDGYTLDGTAAALGWSRQLVGARAKILELPEAAQQLLDTGALPVGAVDTLLAIAAVSGELCAAAVEAVAEGDVAGSQLARDPGWALGQALRGGRCKAFAAYLNTVSGYDVGELRLGKKADAAYREAEQLHQQLDRYTYGPPTIRFEEADVDQARAAGVLIEFDRGAPIITDRALYRELVKQAIARTVEALRASRDEQAAEKAAGRKGQRERAPRERLEAEHRATVRELTARAHGVNLDLGAALLQTLSVVDAGDMDVARFFAYGLLGPDTPSYLGSDDHAARTIAANGIRLVLDEHRATTTPTLKSGQPGKTKVAYGDVDAAAKWLWKFVDGAKTAGELYGRTLVVFAAQHYAEQLVLARSQRRRSALPRSRKDVARKAFERVTKDALPGAHTQLVRALEREARAYAKRQAELDAAARSEREQAADAVDDEPRNEPEDLVDDDEGEPDGD